MTTYLDWNATTPRHPQVVEAMRRAAEDGWANPSSTHQAGRTARRYLEDAREAVARLAGASPRDVVFTSGGTEANHLALAGARWLVTTRLEHPSVVAQAERMAKNGARVAFARVEPTGVVAPESILEALGEVIDDSVPPARNAKEGGIENANTPLVAISAANHETGAVQPVQEILAAARSRGARVHVDAVQYWGRAEQGDLLTDFDSVSLAGHKIRGPKGVGALAFACGWTPQSLGSGGAQERGLRPGTVDAVALAGLRAAVERVPESIAGYRKAGALGRRFQETLLDRGLDGLVIHGQNVARLAHVVNFRVPGWRGDELVAALDLKGVCVSSGSACSAGTAEPSAVIQAMLGREAASGAVRVSFGEDSTEQDLESILRSLTELEVIRLGR